MQRFAVVCLAAAVSLAVSSAHALTYNLIADPGVGGGYSYSGTFTTDGSTGDFSLNSGGLIVDWEVAIETPGGAIEILTPSNSIGGGSFPNGNTLRITPRQVSLLAPPTSGFGRDQFGFAGFANARSAEVRFGGPEFGPGTPFILVGDESNAIGLNLPATAEFVIATRVPEPTAIGLLALGVVAAGRCRR